MSGKNLDRRRMVSGGMALTSVCMLSQQTGATPASADRAFDLQCSELLDEEVGLRSDEQNALLHAPFRAEFLAWLRDSSERFALPVSAHLDAPSTTELRVKGLHPALEILLERGTDINVYVTWQEFRGTPWRPWTCTRRRRRTAPDSRTSCVSQTPSSAPRRRHERRRPEYRLVYPTREACWRDVGFEALLNWFNDELVPATHLALVGAEDCYDGTDWTAAFLVRDGVILRSGRPVGSSKSLRELLPVHTRESSWSAAATGPDATR